jgi:transposase
MKMYKGELTPLYVPDVETQDKRSLGRAKIQASRHVTKHVNEMGSQLRSWGIIVHCSLLSVEGQALVEASKPKLPDLSLNILEMWQGMLKLALETEAQLQAMVEAEAAKDEVCRLLMSIPGVGPVTALVVRAEIGDIRRFRSAQALINYCGLCPVVDQSSDRTTYGKLNRACNRFLKYVLVLRSQGMSRSRQENPMRDTYWRIMLKGKNHAKIAVSRQLTRVIYRMLKDNAFWDASKITRRRGVPARAVA